MQNINQCSCIVCKEVKSVKAIHTHYIRSHSGVKWKNANPIPRKLLRFDTQKEKWKKYYTDPNYCKECNCTLTWFNKTNLTCSNRCAGLYSGRTADKSKKRGPPAQSKKPKLLYSILYKCVCKECGIEWRNRSAVRYCSEHKDKYSHIGRAAFWFSFNVYHYPELFDLDNLTRIGFRSSDNPNGMTRDHRVSVQEAIKNNYEPRYIKHPLNCELMLFRENARKHTKSSITYEQLVAMVDAYAALTT